MPNADPDLLEGLADALAGSAADADALAVLDEAGGAAQRFARALVPKVRAGAPLLSAMYDEVALHPHERALLSAVLSAVPSHAASVATLRVLARRSRDRAERTRAVVAALGTPLAMVALGIVIAPLPNLVLGGDYLRPVLRELGVLLAALLALGVAARALARSSRAGAWLASLARLPLIGAIARAQLDATLATVMAPFADGGCVDPAGLHAAAAVLALAPSKGREPEPIEALASRGSEGLRLLVITAPMAQRLHDRLAQWASERTASAHRALQRAVAALAWTVVLAISVPMMARSLGGGLPTGAGGAIPGLDLEHLQNAEQRELDKILSEPR